MKTENNPRRTEKNIFEAHGTLIITRGKLIGGSALTRQVAKKHGFPCLHIDLDRALPAEAVCNAKAWVDQYKIKVLHVAGPQESNSPGIHDIAFDIVSRIIKD